MGKRLYTRQEWAVLDENTILAARLGFDVSNTAFWISKKDRLTKSTKYSKCNFSNICIWDENCRNIYRTNLKAFLSSHFGKKPVFDNFRIVKNMRLLKWKNVIAPINHPNIYVYDFDNHNMSGILSKKIQEIYERLHKYKDLLIGYKYGFNGMHVFCLSQYKCIVEKECEEFKSINGHVDVFSSKTRNGIGIPGFDHYLYKKEDIEHFIDIAGVQIDKKLSIYQSKPDQSIIYPKATEISPDVLKTIQLYTEAQSNIELHKKGIKNCIMCHHKELIVQGREYINSIMNAKGYRTPILLSTNGHIGITKALTNLNIQDIDTFREIFPDFEENHYKLIEERIEYIKKANRKRISHKISENINYVKRIQKLTVSIKRFLTDNNIKVTNNLLSVSVYLANCVYNNISCPGYIHYIEFCKMNEMEFIPERSYYHTVKECRKYKLISIPNIGVWAVGKKCREIIKGYLLKLFFFEESKKATNKAIDYRYINSVYAKLYCYPLLSTVLCTARSAIITTVNMFNMRNFYSLRP